MEIEKCSKAERDWSKSEGRVSQEAAVAEREETGLRRETDPDGRGLGRAE